MTREVTDPLVAELLARADAGDPLDPQLHANLAMELTVAGIDRTGALRHAREAVPGVQPDVAHLHRAARGGTGDVVRRRQR